MRADMRADLHHVNNCTKIKIPQRWMFYFDMNNNLSRLCIKKEEIFIADTFSYLYSKTNHFITNIWQYGYFFSLQCSHPSKKKKKKNTGRAFPCLSCKWACVLLNAYPYMLVTFLVRIYVTIRVWYWISMVLHVYCIWMCTDVCPYIRKWVSVPIYFCMCLCVYE